MEQPAGSVGMVDLYTAVTAAAPIRHQSSRVVVVGVVVEVVVVVS